MSNRISHKYFYFKKEKSLLKVFDSLNIKKYNKAFLFLNGEVGSGKTTFVRLFMNYMNADDQVTSPTFTLVNEYKVNGNNIYHYDLYRLKSSRELLEIGIDHYIEQDGYHFFEWPEKFLSNLPKPDIEINFTILDNSRLIKVSSYSHE